ncbi:MAG: MFS transporter [Acidimicrobiia bacterium]|nr:MFS transporter [Acidimicrobiia bacterium]
MNQSPGTDGTGSFTRDRLTYLAYGMAIVFGFGLAALGPAMPLLREDLGISRTVGGLHFTALATGAVMAGTVVARVVRVWGRRRVFWSGGTGLATGALLVAIGWHPAVTLSGALITGASGSAMLVVSQASLSDRHPAHRPIAFTEINTAMSVGSVIPAILIGALVGIGVGWRPAWLTPVAAATALAVLFRSESFPLAPSVEQTSNRPNLPGSYWLFLAAFVPSVGAEWCVGAWGADYLVDVVGTAEGSASFLMTAFFGAMVIGRLVGGKVARAVRPLPLVLGTTGVGLLGVLLFWSSTVVLPAAAGLLVAGLGISMQVPMLLALAIGTAPDRPDVAAARVSIAAGGSVIVAPLTLGAVADQVGIRPAFGIVPALFLLLALIAAVGHRVGSDLRPAPPSPSSGGDC